jgi:formiminoglutamase
MQSDLKLCQPSGLKKRIHIRGQETKLGQQVTYLQGADEMSRLPALAAKGIRYALIGIPESIGPRANYGQKGAERAWDVFLNAFLNMQSNRFLQGTSLLCLGQIDTGELNQKADQLDPASKDYIPAMRELCRQLDDIVLPVIQAVFEAGLVPVVIGGGHNNTLPILKAGFKSLQRGYNVLNIDPHADLRPREGRHSGNGFSYAMSQGYLSRYFILGLHEAYNTEFVVDKIIQSQHIGYYPFLAEKDLLSGMDAACHFLKQLNAPVGLELDMDAIAGMPASAYTPSGISLEDARLLIRQIPRQIPIRYLHLAEAAPHSDPHSCMKAGKSLAYLVYDFIQSHQRHCP